MASEAKRLPANVAGELYVDSTCIDCDACRWIAPASFDRVGEHSRVYRQPQTRAELEAAFRALIACPTGSIGSAASERVDSKAEIAVARQAFPHPIDGEVFHSGWHSEASFGATSYFVRRPAARGGNVLVDSPRFSETLARRLEELGGVAWMFLTHADDVADHRRFAERFGCRRVMHADDLDSGTREVELVLDGSATRELDPELLAIPTPGHTRGSACLLFQGTYLFTGDHLAWSPSRGHLYAFRDACWFDWRAQVESMERLAEFEFEWVLPGHGRRARLERSQSRAQMQRCVAWMKAR